MKETVLNFGAHEDLIGILSMPDRMDPNAIPVVVPNTGLEHRVGPNRLHVHLCRALADAGFPALRLDMSAMGDSAASDGAVADSTRDLSAALDALQARGLGSRFIVVGLCSGAHDAHMLIRADTRAVGGALIDGYVYPTARYLLTYFAQRVLDPVRVIRRLFRATQPVDATDQPEGAKEDIEYFRQPTLAEMRRDLASFMGRGLSLSYIYTGQIQNKYNYADQLEDALPELRAYARAEVHYLAMADHTFSRTSMRSELVDVVLSWVRKCATVQQSGLSRDAAAGNRPPTQ
jgi:hypothetical protein